jgi:hypothetical protein
MCAVMGGGKGGRKGGWWGGGGAGGGEKGGGGRGSKTGSMQGPVPKYTVNRHQTQDRRKHTKDRGQPESRGHTVVGSRE